MNFNIKMFLIVVLVVVQMLSLCRSAPTDGTQSGRFSNFLRTTDLKINNLCDKGPNHREMCEKCAKVSRNQYVFPLCCANEDGVADWCEKYMNYSFD